MEQGPYRGHRRSCCTRGRGASRPAVPAQRLHKHHRMVAQHRLRGGTHRDGRLPVSRWPAYRLRVEGRRTDPHFPPLHRASHLRYRLSESSTGGWTYRVQVSHVVLYRWLMSVGLMPRKSLVLGAIDVPAEHLCSFVRGLLDGDGTIYTRVHRPTKLRYPRYRYERLWTSFLSASRAHVEWLRGRLRDALEIDGHVEVRQREGRTTMFRLKYGNRASIVLLNRLHPNEPHPRLTRKWNKWDRYLSRHPQCRRGDLNPHALAGASP